MKIPSDPLGAALWGIDLVLEILSVEDGYERLRTGIAARAEKEGRDVTPEEEALEDAMLEASKRRRDGGAQQQ